MRLVVDVATGAVARQIEYDAWGNVMSDSNPGFRTEVWSELASATLLAAWAG